MQKHTTNVNRKWINKAFKSASKEGKYFSGSSPRAVAHSIVLAHDLHPAFVGKLDQLITALVREGTYCIMGGQLVRSDNVAQRVFEASARHIRHQIVRRERRQARLRGRIAHTELIV